MSRPLSPIHKSPQALQALRKGDESRSGGYAATSVALALAALLGVGVFASSAPVAVAAPPRPIVGESYLLHNDPAPEPRPAETNQAQSPYTAQSPSPEELLRREPSQQQPTAAELLDPESRPWAGAPALLVQRRHGQTKLADNVLAAAGGGSAAVASMLDGTVLLYGTNAHCANPGALSMPNGHPAFALALSSNGNVVAAWAPGTGTAVLFDLSQNNCPTSALRAPLAGDVTLKLSASGTVLLAQDGDGVLWSGVRPDFGDTAPLQRLAALPRNAIVFDFTPNEGVLILVDANGRGSVWNPRSGKQLRGFDVPGGPFVRGEVVDDDVRLWTAEERVVQWDILRNVVVAEADKGSRLQQAGPQSIAAQAVQGKLELRGTSLFFVGERRGWRVSPLYERAQPGSVFDLDRSDSASCLRLADIDGEVRYYSSHTGLPKQQCFAEDWAPVPVRSNGTAQTPELALQIFAPLAVGGGMPSARPQASRVNARAISRGTVYVWRSDGAQPEVQDENTAPSKKPVLLESAVENETTLSVPVRQGLSAAEPPQMLELSRRDRP